MRNRALASVSLLALFAFSCGDDKKKDDSSPAAVEPCPGDAARLEDGTCPVANNANQPGGSGGGGSGGGDGSGGDDVSLPPPDPNPTLELVKAHVVRRTHLDTEVEKRTIGVAFEGDTLECSNDGTTYVACASTKDFIWPVGGIDNTYHFRASKTVNGETKTKTASFKPADFYPGLKIVACTKNVSGNMTFDQFVAAAALNSANQVVCFAHNTVVELDGGDVETQIQFLASGSVLIAKEGHTATIKSSIGTPVATNGFDDLRIVGLKVEDTQGNRVIHVKNNGANRSNGVWLDDLTVNCAGNQSGDCIEITQSGTTSSPIVILESTVSRTNTGNGAALYANDGVVTIESSQFSGGYHALLAFGSSKITATSAGFQTSATTAVAGRGIVKGYKDTEITLSKSSILSRGDYALVLEDFNETIGTKATLNDVMIARDIGNGGGDFAAIYLEDGTIDPKVDSTTNGNTFCNKTGLTGVFNAIFAGATNTGTFSTASQPNGGAIGACTF